MVRIIHRKLDPGTSDIHEPAYKQMVAQGWEDPGGRLAVVVSDRRNNADSPGMSSVTRVLSLFLATKSRSQTDWQSGGSEHDLVARQFERVWAWSAQNQHYGQQGSDDDDRGERSVCLLHPT